MAEDEAVIALEPEPVTQTTTDLTELRWATGGRMLAIQPGAKSARRSAMHVRILRALAALASAAVAARALGVVNQTVISYQFGAGEAMDAYFAVLALPTLLVNLLVSALEASIIPVFIRLSREGREDEASVVLSSLLNLVILIAGIITIVLLLWPGAAVRALAPGVPSRTVAIGVSLAPLIYPTLLLNIVAGFVTSILNARRRFAAPAIAAMLVPLGILVATISLGNLLGVVALSMGLLVGTAVQLVVLLALTRNLRFRYRPILRFGHPDMRSALHQLWPMLVGATIGQANPVVDQAVASLLGSGNISALNYALKVITIPVTVIFMASSRAVFPYFSTQVAARDFVGLKETLRFFAWIVGLITLATSVALIVFAYPLVDVLFHRGAFTTRDSHLTAQVVIGAAAGLVPMALGFLIPRVFSALHRNDLLLKIAVFTLITNVALDILFANVLGLPGIALATSIDYLMTLMVQIAALRGLIGPLGLLVPPVQLRQLSPLRTRRASAVLPHAHEFQPPLTAGDRLPRVARNVAVCGLVLAVVSAVTIRDPVQGLRIAIGLVLAIYFWRAPHMLLLTWAGLGVFYDVYVGDHSIGFVLALASLPVFARVIWQEWSRGTPRMWATWMYVLLLLWLLVGALRSPLGLYQFAVDEVGLGNYVAVMVLAISLLTIRPRFERFVTVLLTSSTLMAAIGVLQYVLHVGGHHDLGSYTIYQVGGIFGWSNSLGFYLDMVLPFSMYRLITAPRGWRQVWAIVFGLHVLALGLTFGRAVIGSAIIMVVVAAVLIPGRLRTWMIRGVVLTAVISIALLFVPGLGLRRRILGDNLMTLNGRTSAWASLLTGLNLRDPIGHGWFASYSVLGSALPGGVGAPHSIYLQMLYDSGVIGFLLLVATFFLLIWGAWRRTLQSQGPARIAAALATGGLVGAVVYLAVGTELWDFALGAYFWLLASVPYLPMGTPSPFQAPASNASGVSDLAPGALAPTRQEALASNTAPGSR